MLARIRARRRCCFVLLLFLSTSLISPPPMHAPLATSAHAYVSSIASVVRQLLLKYGPRFFPFITTIVRNLLQAGARTIQQAYRTKGKTILEHGLKLLRAREGARIAPTSYNKGLVRFLERELERLNTERRILRDAMRLRGIPVP